MLSFDRELLEGFVQESREHLDTLETDLVALETKADDSEIINRIFRAVHTIKGGSGFLGLQKTTKLSHTMENMMSMVREGTLKITRSMMDALLFATDKLRVMIDDPEHSEDMSIDDEFAALEKNLNNPDDESFRAKEVSVEPFSNKEASDTDSVLKGIDSYFLKDALQTGRNVYIVRLYTKKDIEQKNKTPLDVLKEIGSIGEFLDCYTDISGIEGLDNALSFDLIHVFIISTLLDEVSMPTAMEAPASQIEMISHQAIQLFLDSRNAATAKSTSAIMPASTSAPVATATPQPSSLTPTPQPQKQPESQPDVVEKKEIEEMEPPKEILTVKEAPPTTSGGDEASKQQHKAEDTIRVSVTLLDDLMNLAGEMVLGRNQLMRLAENAAKQIPGMPTVLQNVNVVTSEMQEKVMRTRLQPIGTLFSKFARIVRDLSKKLGKEIDLKTSGEDVELDRSIIEALADPLTHLIRNCADHGIELPEQREKLGKRRMGTVQLIASHVGGQVLIQIIDDGKGIDPEKMKKKAIEKGLLKPDEAEKMSDRQAMNIIFLPGFSTAEVVSDVSGRGVGMDVVKTNIEEVGGSVELDSQVGKGTSVSLRLPLTLAIIPAMIVGVGNRRFAVPQVELEEIVNLGANHHIEDVRGMPVLRLRGKLLPLVNLAELLKIENAKTYGKKIITAKDASQKIEETAENNEQQEVNNDRGYVLVLKVDNNRYGVVVDSLLDSEEIVVKPLSSYLKSAQAYSGATIMGDGKVAMIIDSGGISKLADLKFDELHEDALAKALGREEENLTGESQSLLLFRNDATELFAMNLAMIARIEEIKAKDIEYVGKKEYLKYRDSSLRLLRLHDYMPVKKPDTDPETLYVIVPKLVSYPMGIIATKVEDVIRSAVILDEETVTGVGILGSAVIKDELAVFIDVYGLFETADPEKYRWAKKNSLLGKRILLAEDTAFFRAVEIQYLKELACQVDTAVNGIEALERLNHEHYDLLLTDLEMPGMDGFELTQRIRASEKLRKLPIIALTALSAEQYLQKGKEAGVDAYEIKLDKERLRSTLERVLRKDQPLDVQPISTTIL